MMVDAAVLQQAAETIQAGSKSFATAARLFDETTRQSATLLYAWCRHCDDLIDGQELGYGQQQYWIGRPIAAANPFAHSTTRRLRSLPSRPTSTGASSSISTPSGGTRISGHRR